MGRWLTQWAKSPIKLTVMKKCARKIRPAVLKLYETGLLGALMVLTLAPPLVRHETARAVANPPAMTAVANDGDTGETLPACGAMHANLIQSGVASWYGPRFHGHLTSSGETYDMNKLTAAHRTLPINTQVLVTNRLNGESVVLRINDRGPYVHGRLIDLSLAAAKALGMRDIGKAPVKVQILCRPPPETILLSPPRKPANI